VIDQVAMAAPVADESAAAGTVNLAAADLVQGDEGPAQVVQLGHRGTPSVICQRRWCHLLRRLPHTISPLEGDGFEPSVPPASGAACLTPMPGGAGF
jgi:hypothetical protein